MNSRTRRTLTALLASVAVCLLTVIIGKVVHQRHLRSEVREEIDYLRQQLNRNVTVRNFDALRAIAESAVIQAYANDHDGEPQDVLGVLVGAQRAMGADFVYLMNADGDVVACSPYDGGKTLTGKNYKIRPYFLRAKSGKDCLYGALGITTNRRGFYFSVPVAMDEASAKLVLIAKIGLDSVDQLLADFPDSAVLKTPSGIIFSCNQRRWLFRPADDLTDEELTRIRATKQFTNEALERLPFSLTNDGLRIDGQAQLIARSEIGAPGWELIAWKPSAFPVGAVLIYGGVALVVLWSVLLVLHTIRRRREIQHRLLLSKQDYEGIFNASADAIFIHHPDNGDILEVNQRTCEMYGGTPADFVGKSVESITSGEPQFSKDRALQLIGGMTDDEERLFEWHARRLDGTLFWVEVHLTVMQLKGERRVIAVVRDVTERHDHIDRLRKLSGAIEESPASVVITDVHGHIEYVNKAFSSITGFSSDEVIGKNPRIFSSGKHPSSYYKELWDTVLDGAIWTGEICNAKRDGSLFWELSRIAPILDKDGKLTHFVAVKVDISDLKRTQEMLGEAKRDAENADRAKSTFLANMSHEIRTPMNAIMGFLDLTLKEPLPDSLRGNLEVSHKSATELLVLINNILDTSKLDSGKMLLEDTQFSLVEVCNEVAALFSPKADEKQVSFDLDLSDQLAPAYIGDRGKLKQVLSNIVGNAIKFTPAGGVTVKVQPKGDDWLQFEIRDTGIGIPSDKIESIFDPFTQGDGSTTRRFGGTGLGTTISRQLVELMGGKIWVRSKEAEGSEFSFEIPLVPISSRAHRVDNPSKHRLSDTETSALKVLMAEDVEANVALAEQWFSKTNYSLLVARDGVEAVDAFKLLKPDVVLMDIHMPKMDGVEAVREIRRLPDAANVPIIALTASVMKEEVDEYLAAGMDAVVGKPIDFRELCIKIQALTGNAIDDGDAKESPSECPKVLKGMIDWDGAMERWGDPEFFLDSFRMFVDEQLTSLIALETSVDNGEFSVAAERAHSLKGVFGNLSLIECFELAMTVEQRIAAGELEGIAPPLAALGEALRKVVVAARSLR